MYKGGGYVLNTLNLCQPPRDVATLASHPHAGHARVWFSVTVFSDSFLDSK